MSYLKIMIIDKFLYELQMLYYDKIDISKGIDINKTSASKDCCICHYWYFVNNGFRFEPDVCNGCLDVLMMF